MCLAQILVGPLVASGGVAWLCRAAGLEGRPASFWILAAPLFYVVWLFGLLIFYVLETSLLRLFYQKPRRYDTRQKHGLSAIHHRGRALRPWIYHPVHCRSFRS